MVLWLYGSLLMGRRVHDEPASDALNTALFAYGPDKKGPHLSRARAEMQAYHAYRYWMDDPEGAAPWATEAGKSLRAALMEPDLTPLEQRWVANCAAEMCIEMPEAAATEFLKQLSGESLWTGREGEGPWAMRLIAGAHHRRLAWDARGGGVASTVTDEGWEGFRKHLDLAREYLEAAHDMAPDRPEAAAKMIGVSMGRGEADEPQEWFKRAVAAQFDWYPAYRDLLWALRPRWGGSREEMLRFGIACAATERYDTVAPEMLYHAVLSIADDTDYDSIWRLDEVYDMLSAAAEAILAERPGAYAANTWRRRLLTIAWRAGDYAEAAKWLPTVTYPPHGSRPHHARSEFDQIRSDVLLHTSGIREVGQALDAESRESWAEMQRLLEGVLPQVEPGSDLEWAVQDRLAIARFQRAYARRIPVEVPLTEHLAGWRQHSGRWRVEDGVLVGDHAGDDGCEIVFGPALGEHWLAEARVSMEVDEHNRGFGANMILNWEHESDDEPRYDSVRISGNFSTVRVGYRRGTKTRFQRQEHADHLIRVERSGDQLKVWFDEELIHDGPTTSRNWPRSGRIGFAIDRTTVPRGAIRIRDIAVKRIVRGGMDEVPF